MLRYLFLPAEKTPGLDPHHGSSSTTRKKTPFAVIGIHHPLVDLMPVDVDSQGETHGKGGQLLEAGRRAPAPAAASWTANIPQQGHKVEFRRVPTLPGARRNQEKTPFVANCTPPLLKSFYREWFFLQVCKGKVTKTVLARTLAISPRLRPSFLIRPMRWHDQDPETRRFGGAPPPPSQTDPPPPPRVHPTQLARRDAAWVAAKRHKNRTQNLFPFLGSTRGAVPNVPRFLWCFLFLFSAF